MYYFHFFLFHFAVIHHRTATKAENKAPSKLEAISSLWIRRHLVVKEENCSTSWILINIKGQFSHCTGQLVPIRGLACHYQQPWSDTISLIQNNNKACTDTYNRYPKHLTNTRRRFWPWFFQYLWNDLIWGCARRYVCPCEPSWEWNATMDIDRSQGNVQLQVVASCCHWAHLSKGNSWEAGGGRSEGRHSTHRWWSRQGSCQAGCWPCLAPVFPWNFFPLRSQFQSNNIPALMEYTVDSNTGSERDFPTWIEYSSVLLSLYLLAIALCWLLRCWD